MITSKTHIRTNYREFATLEELIESTKTNGIEKELLGPVCHWFKNEAVLFPDKGYYSSSFVEVHNDRVLVGYPSKYITYIFPSWREALLWADCVNKKWLKFTGSPDEFLKLLH